MSFMESIQKRRFLPTMPLKDELPISHAPTNGAAHLIGLRHRISVSIQPLSSTIKKSASMHSISKFAGGPLRRWWDWSWGWVLSRKPAFFADDLEMNEEETKMLGCENKGTLRHVFYRVRSEVRKLVGPSTLPTTQSQRFRYDSYSYAEKFNGGFKKGVE